MSHLGYFNDTISIAGINVPLYLATLILLKLFHYTPSRRLGGEDIQLLSILDLGTRWG
jgi:hypothetical protein